MKWVRDGLHFILFQICTIYDAFVKEESICVTRNLSGFSFVSIANPFLSWVPRRVKKIWLWDFGAHSQTFEEAGRWIHILPRIRGLLTKQFVNVVHPIMFFSEFIEYLTLHLLIVYHKNWNIDKLAIFFAGFHGSSGDRGVSHDSPIDWMVGM